MGVLAFASGCVGQLFRSHVAEFGAAWLGPTQTRARPIDVPRSGYLSRPSSPVRQHASSRRNDTLPRPILGPFFPKARCARQVEQTSGAKQFSSTTSTGGAAMALLSLRRLTVRALLSKPRLAARHALRTRATVTACMPLDTHAVRRMALVHGSFNVVGNPPLMIVTSP